MSEQWIKTLSNSETEQLIRVLSYLPMKKYTFLEKPPTLKRQDKKYVQQLLEKLSSIVV